MKRKLICYTLPALSSSMRNTLRRELFGSVEYTHQGKYCAQTIGLLAQSEYEKPIRSVLVVDASKVSGVVLVLEKYGAIVYVYELA